MKPAFKQREYKKAGELIDELRYCKTCKKLTPTKVSITEADVYFNVRLSPEPDGQVNVKWGNAMIDKWGYWGKVTCEHCGTEKDKFAEFLKNRG